MFYATGVKRTEDGIKHYFSGELGDDFLTAKIEAEKWAKKYELELDGVRKFRNKIN